MVLSCTSSNTSFTALEDDDNFVEVLWDVGAFGNLQIQKRTTER